MRGRCGEASCKMRGRCGEARSRRDVDVVIFRIPISESKSGQDAAMLFIDATMADIRIGGDRACYTTKFDVATGPCLAAPPAHFASSATNLVLRKFAPGCRRPMAGVTSDEVWNTYVAMTLRGH